MPSQLQVALVREVIGHDGPVESKIIVGVNPPAYQSLPEWERYGAIEQWIRNYVQRRYPGWAIREGAGGAA